VGPHGFAVAECLHLLPMEINENQQVFSGFAGRCRGGVEKSIPKNATLADMRHISKDFAG